MEVWLEESMQHSFFHPGQCEKVDGELPHPSQWAPINMGRTALAVETQNSEVRWPLPLVYLCACQDKVTLCSLGWPRTWSVDQDGFQHTEIFASGVLGLKVWATTPRQNHYFGLGFLSLFFDRAQVGLERGTHWSSSLHFSSIEFPKHNFLSPPIPRQGFSMQPWQS